MVRFKNRYFLCSIDWQRDASEEQPTGARTESSKYAMISGSISATQLTAEVRNSLLNRYGAFGLGCCISALQVKYFSAGTNTCLLRVARDYHKEARVAVSSITSISGYPCSLRILHVGGTIRSCQKAALIYDRALLQELQQLSKEHDGDDDDDDGNAGAVASMEEEYHSGTRMHVVDGNEEDT